ncbi:hypothetical protein FRC09_001839, partial [Ceratobasidium sp. 395]
LATSAIPAFPNPFGATSAPNSGTTTPSPNVTVPQTTRRQATAVTRPQISAASAPTTPPTTINATLEPALAPVLSRPAIAVAPVAPVAPVTAIVAPVATSAPTSVVHTAPAPAPALARRITSAGLPARPPSTTPCKYFSSKKGCARVGFCPFRHGDESSAGPSRANSGDARVGASGVLPMAPVANSSTNSQAANAQPGSGDPSRTSPGVVVKTEQESPAPKLAGRISGAQAKSRAGPPATSRRVKEEEVTLRDLGDDHAASSDRDMADGTAKDKGPILPPSLSSAPSAQAPKPVAPSNQSNVQAERRPVEPPKTPVVVRVPPSTAAPAPASRPAPAPVSASTSAPAPAPTSAPAPVPLVPSTAVIPPTPAHPPVANKTTVPQPSVAPARLPSRDSGRLDPRDRRELLTRMQDPPPRHGSRHSRTLGGRFLAHRRRLVQGADLRSRVVILHVEEVIPHRALEDTPHHVRALDLRVGGMVLCLSHLGLEDTHQEDLGRLVMTPGMLGIVVLLVALEARIAIVDEARRLCLETEYPLDRPAQLVVGPLAILLERFRRDHQLIAGRVWIRVVMSIVLMPAPSTRPPQSTVSREDTGYTTGHAHHPPEVNARWDHHSPLRAEPTNYEQNPRTGRDTREPIHPNHSGGPGQEPHYDPGLRAGFSVGIPQASSTPGRPPVLVESSNNPIPGLPKKPIVMPADYDNFEQSMVMETASPEARNPASSRLQERVSEYPGFVPASFVPVENTPRLYARMTQGEQLPLSERLASSETHQPMRVTYNKGPKLTNSNNNSQLAARLGVNNGERSQPLANRLQDEARSRPSYQNRDREPQARPGGGLMARMVGDKKQVILDIIKCAIISVPEFIVTHVHFQLYDYEYGFYCVEAILFTLLIGILAGKAEVIQTYIDEFTTALGQVPAFSLHDSIGQSLGPIFEMCGEVDERNESFWGFDASTHTLVPTLGGFTVDDLHCFINTVWGSRKHMFWAHTITGVSALWHCGIFVLSLFHRRTMRNHELVPKLYNLALRLEFNTLEDEFRLLDLVLDINSETPSSPDGSYSADSIVDKEDAQLLLRKYHPWVILLEERHWRTLNLCSLTASKMVLQLNDLDLELEFLKSHLRVIWSGFLRHDECRWDINKTGPLMLFTITTLKHIQYMLTRSHLENIPPCINMLFTECDFVNLMGRLFLWFPRFADVFSSNEDIDGLVSQFETLHETLIELVRARGSLALTFFLVTPRPFDIWADWNKTWVFLQYSQHINRSENNQALHAYLGTTTKAWEEFGQMMPKVLDLYCANPDCGRRDPAMQCAECRTTRYCNKRCQYQ